jgi:phage recombination protein Bet
MTQPATAIAVHDGNFSREQLELLKRTIAKGTTDDEFDLFLGTCRRLKLDPWRRQIYCMPTWDHGQKTYKSVVSIDGFRSLAEDTGEYEGQSKPEWFDEAGERWVDVWTSHHPPAAARIGVYRKGFREPLVRVARYEAYCVTNKDGKPNPMWIKMHAEQLLKCAEALALRAAFPGPLSGVYSEDEMGQAANGHQDDPQQQSQQQAAPAQLARPLARADVGSTLRFSWPKNKTWHGVAVVDAPPGVMADYIELLTGVLNDKAHVKIHEWAVTHRAEVEAVYQYRLAAEAPKISSVEVARKMQEVMDGALADPSDENAEWGVGAETHE